MAISRFVNQLFWEIVAGFPRWAKTESSSVPTYVGQQGSGDLPCLCSFGLGHVAWLWMSSELDARPLEYACRKPLVPAWSGDLVLQSGSRTPHNLDLCGLFKEEGFFWPSGYVLSDCPYVAATVRGNRAPAERRLRRARRPVLHQACPPTCRVWVHNCLTNGTRIWKAFFSSSYISFCIKG